MPDDASPKSPAPEPIGVPDWAPPFDDALAPAADHENQELEDQELSAEMGTWERLPPPGPPDPWPSQFAQALAEALSGARPAGQLVPWTTVQARKRISQLSPVLAASQRPRLRRVIANSPADGVLELAIVASYGSRVRAVAVRLERGRPDASSPGEVSPHGEAGPALPGRPRPGARWYCTAIEAA